MTQVFPWALHCQFKKLYSLYDTQMNEYKPLVEWLHRKNMLGQKLVPVLQPGVA